jgi:ribosomal protein L34
LNKQELAVKNHRKSLAKRARKSGFLTRQRTSKGRAINNRKRSSGRTVGVKRSFT